MNKVCKNAVRAAVAGVSLMFVSNVACAALVITSSIDAIEPTGTSSDRPTESAAERSDTSLLGVDADADTVRDDVERYIYNNYTSDRDFRAKLYRLASLMTIFYRDYPPGSLTCGWYGAFVSSIDGIVAYRSAQGDGKKIAGEIIDEVNSLPDRQKYFYQFMDNAPEALCK